MHNKRFKLEPAVAIMLKKDNKIVLTKRSKPGWGTGAYALPGGGVDGGETVMQAGARELKEELGVTVNPEDLKLLHVMHHFRFIDEKKSQPYETVVFFLEIEKWQGEPYNVEKNLHSSIEWHDMNNLPKNVVSELSQALQYINQGKIYSEHGWQGK